MPSRLPWACCILLVYCLAASASEEATAEHSLVGDLLDQELELDDEITIKRVLRQINFGQGKFFYQHYVVFIRYNTIIIMISVRYNNKMNTSIVIIVSSKTKEVIALNRHKL